jgi:hypothetical protein
MTFGGIANPGATKCMALFNIAVETLFGNGESTKFWLDR